MMGLSLTSTVAERDATIATLRAALDTTNAVLLHENAVTRRLEGLLDDAGSRHAALVAKLADFADRSIPPKPHNGPVAQPKSTPDADAAVVRREREKAKRTPV